MGLLTPLSLVAAITAASFGIATEGGTSLARPTTAHPGKGTKAQPRTSRRPSKRRAGQTVPLGRATRSKAKARSAKLDARRARVSTAPALSGRRKSKTIATLRSQLALDGLVQSRLLRFDFENLTDGVGFFIHDGFVSRAFAEQTPPVASFRRGGRVAMMLDAKPGSVYLFDCGISGTQNVDFFAFEFQGAAFEGSATVTTGRAIFAHAYSGDAEDRMTMNLTVDGDTSWTFSGCEVTELSERARRFRDPSTGTVAR